MAENDNVQSEIVHAPKPKSIVSVVSQMETEDLLVVRLWKQEQTFKKHKQAIDARLKEITAARYAISDLAKRRMQEVADTRLSTEGCFENFRAAFARLGISPVFELRAADWHDIADEDCVCILHVKQQSRKKQQQAPTIFKHELEMKRPHDVTDLLQQLEKLNARERELQQVYEQLLRDFGDTHSRNREARLALLRWKATQVGGEEIMDIIQELNQDSEEEERQAAALEAAITKPLPALPAP